MITKKIEELLKNREFLNIATCDFSGRPNVAPKFLLKLETNFIYLVDYVISRTWENLKVNPKASLSIMDNETLIGYQINGSVRIIDNGPEYDKVLNELHSKEIMLSSKRIIEGLHRGQKHKIFEAALPEKVVAFKVKIEEIIEIGSSGQLKREKV